MAKKVYLSSKITGDPDYKSKFFAKELELKAQGYEVVNPAWLENIIGKGLDYDTYLKAATKLMLACDLVVMFGDWQSSKGCAIEKSIALTLGIMIELQEPAPNIEAAKKLLEVKLKGA
jgi:hypothetical protein